MSQCPCLSGKPYGDCCQPLHQGQSTALTAEQLMRSRYSAFVFKNKDYLVKTWHPDYRPEQIDLSDDVAWVGLSIVASSQGGISDLHGKVHFRAFFKNQKGEMDCLEEQSDFIKQDEQWLYIAGKFVKQKFKISRNMSCPCGSGKKYKRCCA